MDYFENYLDVPLDAPEAFALPRSDWIKPKPLDKTDFSTEPLELLYISFEDKCYFC